MYIYISKITKEMAVSVNYLKWETLLCKSGTFLRRIKDEGTGFWPPLCHFGLLGVSVHYSAESRADS